MNLVILNYSGATVNFYTLPKRIKERRDTIMNEEGTDLYNRYVTVFDGQIDAVVNEHDSLMKEIYEAAIENFINIQNN
jgi:hypothetical protein